MLAHIGSSVFAFLATPAYVNEDLLKRLAKESDELIKKSEYPKALEIQKEWLLGSTVPTME